MLPYLGEMAVVKAQELSPGQWQELLEPYGWADITVRAPAVLFRVPSGLLEYEIRVMLRPGHDVSGAGQEWAERSHLLEQARAAVDAVRGKGYVLADPPRIEFGGRYMYFDPESGPAWAAEAEVRFSVSAR